MKRKRLVIYLLFLLAFLILLVGINLQVLTTQLVTKERVAEALQSIFEQPVRIGEVKFRWLKGIEIYRLEILSDDENNKLLNADLVKISYNKIALLERKLALEEIEFVSPELNLLGWQIQKKKRPQTQITSLPHIIIRNGKVSLAETLFFKKDYVQVLEKVNLDFYPFSNNRYLVEGQIEAGLFGSWSIKGEMDLTYQNTTLTALSKNINLNEPFLERLSEPLKHIWNRYQPQGLVNLAFNINYQENRPKPLDVQAIIDCQNTRMTFIGFPYQVSNLTGRIELHESGLLIKNLQGKNGQTVVNINGHSDGYNKEAGFVISLNIKNLNFDQKLHLALNDNLKNVWKNINPAGMIDVAGEITRPAGPDHHENYRLNFSCQNNQFKIASFPYPLSEVQGEIEFKDNVVKIKSLLARRDKTKIKIAGEWDGLTQNAGYLLNIEAVDVELKDYALKDAFTQLAKGGAKLWEESQPSGPVDLRLQLKRPSALGGGLNQKTTTRLFLDCKSISLKYGPSQYPLSGLTGQIEYYDPPSGDAPIKKTTGPEAHLKRLVARNQKTNFEITGKVRLPDSFETTDLFQQYEININGTDVPVDAGVKNLLPDSLKNFFNQISLAGEVDFSLELDKKLIASAQRPEENDYQTNYKVLLKLLDCSAEPGISLTKLNGNIDILGEILKQDSSSKGILKLNHAKTADKVFENISCSFTQHGNRFNFYNVQGTIYKGIAASSLVITTTDYSYLGEIDIRGVDIKELARDTFMAGQDISGQLAVKLEFSGLGKDP
ncbi:MAG: hypothetical protein AAB019_11380 [Planctomycetota bacterium]